MPHQFPQPCDPSHLTSGNGGRQVDVAKGGDQDLSISMGDYNGLFGLSKNSDHEGAYVELYHAPPQPPCEKSVDLRRHE